MGLFKSKKKEELPLPPPPPKMLKIEGDIEPIRPFDIPELPPLPEPVQMAEPQPIPMPQTISEPKMFEPEPSFGPVEKETPKRFIAVEDYKQIIEESNSVRAKIMEADELVKHLENIKSQEELMFQKWRANLEQIEKKLSRVDKVVSEARG